MKGDKTYKVYIQLKFNNMYNKVAWREGANQ